MRYQLRATFTVEDEDALIETARCKAKVDGGDPEFITNGGLALIELLEMVDEERQPLLFDFTLEDLDAFQLCDNSDCGRKLHPQRHHKAGWGR